MRGVKFMYFLIGNSNMSLLFFYRITLTYILLCFLIVNFTLSNRFYREEELYRSVGTNEALNDRSCTSLCLYV